MNDILYEPYTHEYITYIYIISRQLSTLSLSHPAQRAISPFSPGPPSHRIHRLIQPLNSSARSSSPPLPAAHALALALAWAKLRFCSSSVSIPIRLTMASASPSPRARSLRPHSVKNARLVHKLTTGTAPLLLLDITACTQVRRKERQKASGCTSSKAIFINPPPISILK